MPRQRVQENTAPLPVPAEPSVFISYRRAEAAGWAGHLHDDLERRLGAGRVFYDHDMTPGTNWVTRLRAVAGACHVMLVVIGRQWTTVTKDDSSTPRLADPGDTLRIELETALSRDEVAIIPVLVDGARMPEAHELPASLAALCDLQAFPILDARWQDDITRLTAVLEQALGPTPERVEPIVRRRPRAPWLALAGAAGAAVLAAPLSATLAHRPIDQAASLISSEAQARERVIYYALERGLFWGLVGACVLVVATLVAASDRPPLAAGIVGFGAGAVGGFAGGLAYQGLKFLANPAIGVLSEEPKAWQLQMLNVALPAMFIGWAFGGRPGGPTRLEAAFVGLACGLIAVPAAATVDTGYFQLVIQAAIVTAPLALLLPARGRVS